MMSCHLAKIYGHSIEGYVPAKEIKDLLNELPNALGFAVLEMPTGSPGIGSEDDREAHDVSLIKNDGRFDLFQHYPEDGLLAQSVLG